MMTEDTPFRILAVCTGNICRSPMVERLLQHSFDKFQPGQVEVTSAGTGALVGRGIDPKVARKLQELDADPAGFAARQLNDKILGQKDLILSLTRDHRSAVVQRAPHLLKRTFTLRELARLITPIDGDASMSASERWRAVLPKVSRVRKAHPISVAYDDVIDPFQRADSVYEQMVDELLPAVNALIQWEQQHR